MRNGLVTINLRGRATAVKACAVHVLQHVRFHNTSGVGPHGARVARKVHHADVPHPRFLQEPKKCAVFGAPMTWGQPRAGTDNGPEMIRRAGLSQELGNLGWNVEDLGDLDIAPPSDADPQVENCGDHHSRSPWNSHAYCSTFLQGDPAYLKQMKNCYAVGKGCQKVFETVTEQAAAGKFVLTLGGDHSIGAGT